MTVTTNLAPASTKETKAGGGAQPAGEAQVTNVSLNQAAIRSNDLAPYGGLAALIPDVSPNRSQGDSSNMTTTNALEMQMQHNILQLPQQQHQQGQTIHSLHQQSVSGMVGAGSIAMAPGRRDSLNMLGNMTEQDEEDSEDETGRGERRAGRRKIQIAYIEDKSRRHITFSKRKAGIMKKAYELSTLTGTQVLLLVASETGHVYTFATPKLQPLITKPEGKNLIQACLNAPDMPGSDYANSPNYDHDDNGKEALYEEARANAAAAVQGTSGVPAASYAAAMANLAGFPYPAGQVSAASAAFLNAANFPSSYAQYNAALAAGYWPGSGGAGPTGAAVPPSSSSKDNTSLGQGQAGGPTDKVPLIPRPKQVSGGQQTAHTQPQA